MLRNASRVIHKRFCALCDLRVHLMLACIHPSTLLFQSVSTVQWTGRKKTLWTWPIYTTKYVLWDPNNPKYYNKLHKHDSWKRTVKAMGTVPEKSKKMMDSLLSSFRRETGRNWKPPTICGSQRAPSCPGRTESRKALQTTRSRSVPTCPCTLLFVFRTVFERVQWVST